MRKVLITCLYPNEANPIFSISVTDALKNMGFDVYAVIEKSTLNKQDWVSKLGDDHIEYINITHVTKKFSEYTKYINAARYAVSRSSLLFPKFRNIEFDYVIYSFYHHWNDILIKKFKSKQNVLFLHDPIPHSGEATRRFREQKIQANKMDHIVLLSRKFIPIVHKEYNIDEDKIHYMPHGAMDYQNSSSAQYVKLDESKGLNYLFFGRITEYKGIDVLLRAYSKVMTEVQNCHLTVAGNGDFLKYENLLPENDRITILNRYIDDSEISDLFLKENTVLILPYVDASQSGVIPIAASYGNPIIASDTGGLREQLDDGNIGIFVEVGSAGALADMMINVNKSRVMLEEQSGKMIEYNKSLAWDVIIKKLIKELEEY